MKKAMSIRIDEKLLQEIKAIAKKQERSTNSAIVLAIKKYIEDNK